VGAVRLEVGDLHRSIDYYEQVIGLRVQRRASEGVLGAGASDRALVRLQEKRGIQRVPGRGMFGLYHFAVLLPERAALGRFAAHLAEIGARFAAADHLVSEALYLWDPDGLGIEVYADRPRTAWKHRGRELTMTTEPLDMPDLIAGVVVHRGKVCRLAR
jgi:catechol 2,3-dioxygenase